MPEQDKPEEKRLTIRLDPELHRQLRRKSVEEDRSLQEMVLAWIREAMDPESGRKGGTVYPSGGLPAMHLADRS